jgi:hypothetical protein
MSFDIATSRGTTIDNLLCSTPLGNKKIKKETDDKAQAPDDLIRQRGKAPDKNGKIVAGDFVPAARPVVPVKTPSFKAPKQLGQRKPAMIANGPHPFVGKKDYNGKGIGDCKECGKGYKDAAHWRKA